MRLEDYFDFLSDDDIRLKGTRIGIETILYDFLHGSQTPESIAARYPAVNLEQVYATITYYLNNKESVRAYLERWLEHGRAMRAQQERNPSDAVLRLRKLKAGRETVSAESASDPSA